MYKGTDLSSEDTGTVEDKLKRYSILKAEADTVSDQDNNFIRNMFNDFYNHRFKVGLGFQRAYGSILSGDYFDLIALPDNNFMFVFADISGHGLPAYTTLIKLKAAITVSLKGVEKEYSVGDIIDTDIFVKNIVMTFTDIMEESVSKDFACVNFTFLYEEDKDFRFRFYNRSMLFPVVLKKHDDCVKLENLNEKSSEWKPIKGHLLSNDMREIVGENEYYKSPYVEYVLSPGDSIFYYSDGLIEAHSMAGVVEDFGEKRLEDMLYTLNDQEAQLTVNEIFGAIYQYIGSPERQYDDMSAVYIDFSL